MDVHVWMSVYMYGYWYMCEGVHLYNIWMLGSGCVHVYTCKGGCVCVNIRMYVCVI